MYRGFTGFLTLAGVFIGGWLAIRFLLPVTLPFLLGLCLALAAEPMARPLRRRIGAGPAALVSVTLAFCLLSSTLLFLAAFSVRQLGNLTTVLPDMESAVSRGFGLAQARLLELAEHSPAAIRPLVQRNVTELFSDGSALVDRGVQLVLSLAGNALTHVPDSALTLITGLISAYLISARLPALVRKLPRERLRAILSAWKRIRTAVGGWLLAQGKLMGVSFAIVLAGLLLLRVRWAFLWAVGISLVDAFPILGIGTVLLPWAALDFLQGDTPRALGLLGIWVTVSVLRSVLEPKLLGKQLGLDPLVTLMALYAGYKLLGIAGIILAPLLTVTALQLIPKRSDKL